jgi:hypothetical protein
VRGQESNDIGDCGCLADSYERRGGFGSGLYWQAEKLQMILAFSAKTGEGTLVDEQRGRDFEAKRRSNCSLVTRSIEPVWPPIPALTRMPTHCRRELPRTPVMSVSRSPSVPSYVGPQQPSP